MKIVVDEAPKRPDECIWGVKDENYGPATAAAWECHLQPGFESRFGGIGHLVCDLWKSGKCPYLIGVREVTP